MKHYKLEAITVGIPRADMKHYPLTITDWQRSNLQKLVAYLKTGKSPIGFDMNMFLSDPYDDEGANATIKHNCGSIGCLVGHGPQAGIKPHNYEGWDSYAQRVFGSENFPTSKAYPIWDWLFDTYWSDVDNTPEGGIARVEYALAHGIPSNYENQMRGKEELCYDKCI